MEIKMTLKHGIPTNVLLFTLVFLWVIVPLMAAGERKMRQKSRSVVANDHYQQHHHRPEGQNSVLVPGDVHVGVLISLHGRGADGECGNISQEGIVALESLLYTLDKVNDFKSLIHNTTLGVYVRDSCDDPDYVLRQALGIMEGRFGESERWSYICPDGSSSIPMAPRIMGVVTGITSAAPIVQAASLLQLFRIPQVNAWERSPLMRTVGRFPYMYHSIPSYFQQLDLVIELLKRISWSYVSVLAEESEYGSWMTFKLMDLLRANNICMAMLLKFQAGPGILSRKQEFDQIVNQLLFKHRARGVIVITESDRMVGRLLAALKRHNVGRRLVFFGLGWSNKVHGKKVSKELEGAIILQPVQGDVVGFEDYFLSLNPRINERNPWFREYWESIFNCRFLKGNHGKRICSGKESLSKRVTELGSKTVFTSNAIMAFAYALHTMHSDVCGGKPGLCANMTSSNGEALRKYLEKIRFKTLSGQNFQFLSNREPQTKYTLLNFQKDAQGTYKWVELGHASNRDLTNITLSLLRFRKNEPSYPWSSCQTSCRTGEFKSMMKSNSCCWVCTPCKETSIMPAEDQCQPCPSGYQPNLNRTVCVQVRMSSPPPTKVGTTKTSVQLNSSKPGSTIFAETAPKLQLQELEN